MAYKLLVGGYTEDGLRVLTFTPNAQSGGKLELQQTTIPAGSNPSWIAQHPSDDSLLFVANEVEDGRLIAIKLSTGDAVAGQIAVNVSSAGSHPAHLKILKDSVVIGNYMGGSILDIPYTTTPFKVIDASKEKKPGNFVEFSGTGPDSSRQERSHPHEVYQHGEELLIPDLGADKTWILTKGTEGWKTSGSVEYPSGSGPRHVLVHDGILYTVLELTNQISLHPRSSLLENPKPAVILSTFSSGSPPDPSTLAAEILLSPNKKFIYVSNRNDPSPEGDTIAVFNVPSSTNPEECKLVNEIRTGVQHVRGMNLSKDGKFLAIAGKNTNAAKIFEIIEESENGGLKEVASATGLDGPTCVIWI